MQHLTKEKVLLAYIVASLIIFAILISHLFMLLVTTNTITNVSAVGDLNGDGKVSIADVKIIDWVYSGIIEEPLADINGDGTIGIGDIKILDLIYSGIL